MSQGRPNILFICSDQHSARVTGAYGDSIDSTPNLNALGAGGCVFDACYCASPVCGPSRMSLMTGRYPFRCDCIENGSVLDSRYPTLAHIAVRGGYHAMLAGRMHFVGPDQRHGFLERPIGDIYSYSLYGAVRPPATGLSPDTLGNCSRPDALFHVGAGGNPFVEYDRAVAGAAISRLREYARHEDAPPFFMTVGFMLPHCPYIAPPGIFSKYQARVRAPRLNAEELQNLHPHHRAYRKFIDLDRVPEGNFDRAAAAYYAMVEILDGNVGRILEALGETGALDDTIVVYFSDHGEMLGQHGRWHKECFFEDAARVPLIIRHPECAGPSRSAAPCSLLDLMPTLCDLTGIAPPPGIDGVSLAPVLFDKTPPPARAVKVESYSYWEKPDWGRDCNRMIRQGKWKFCYYGASDSCELFDLETDPEERRNLAGEAEFGDLCAKLRREVFADGWSLEIGRDYDELLRKNGWQDNVQKYADSVRTHPLPVEAPGYWHESFPTWVDSASTDAASQPREAGEISNFPEK